jgi:hypothetical protein
MDKWDNMKLKSFCTTKQMVSKLKRPPTEWEKIFAGYTLDKGLINRMYREFKKLTSPKIKELIKKWATKLEIIFSKKKSKWPENTCKNIHLPWPLRKCKSKPH